MRGHFPVYFHLRGTNSCGARVLRDVKRGMDGGGNAGIRFGQRRRWGLAYRVESTRVVRSKQGMQLTVTLHSPFPTLSSSSTPLFFPIWKFQLGAASFLGLLLWATCQNISCRDMKSNQAAARLGTKIRDLNITRGRVDPPKKT